MTAPRHVALVMPAETRHMGGVLRFAHSVRNELEELCDIRTLTLHPAEDERSPAARIAAQTRGLRELRRMVAGHTVSGVITTYHWPPSLSRKVPMVGYVHDVRSWGLHADTLPTGARSSARAALLAGTWRTWSAIAVPSDHVADSVRRLIPDGAVHVVPEGLDHVKVGAPVGEDRTQFLVLASSAPHKRADLGVAAGRLLADELRLRCAVIGAGVAHGDATGLDIHLSPSDAEMSDLYRCSAFLVAPTSYEGFGLAVGEAMRCGVPVLYADDAHLSSVVGPGGVACAPSPEGFLDGGRRLWADLDQYRNAARATAAQHRWRTTVEQLLRLLWPDKGRDVLC